MPSSYRITKVFFIVLLCLASGCASDRPPSGGPLDTTPLRVIFSDPAPSAVQVSTEKIRLTFNHALSARQLLNSVIISPSIGAFDIAVSGKNMEIKGFRPLEQEQTYTLTIDRKLSDSRGRTFATPYRIAFSTGAVIDRGIIRGTVINADCSPATNALIVAFAERPEAKGSPGLLQREPDYFIQADSSGAFSLEHLAKGLYRMVAFNDRNGDLRIDTATEEIGLCSTAILPTATSNLLFRLSEIPRKGDKVPPRASSNTHAPDETGSISGTCFASGQYAIVEASSSTASYRTTASRTRNGELSYTFPELPRGSYTITACIPANGQKPDPERQWNPGSIEPFQPAEPFGFYPEKVTVRPRWTAEHIDIRITTYK